MSKPVLRGHAASYLFQTMKQRTRLIAGAAVVLALGASSGASAQCSGTYQAGSGSGSHGATTSGGLHPASSATHASTSSSCGASAAKTTGGSNLSFHPATAGLGTGKSGVGSTSRHTSVTSNGVNKSAGGKKVKL